MHKCKCNKGIENVNILTLRKLYAENLIKWVKTDDPDK